MRVVHAMVGDGGVAETAWRPVTAARGVGSGTPTSVSSLVVSCCAAVPGDRPSFASILEALSGPCKVEVDAGDFRRHRERMPAPRSEVAKKGAGVGEALAKAGELV